MKKFLFKNHQLVCEKQAQVSINERAFLFGDGIFESCKIFNGIIYNFESHKKRIETGLKSLKFNANISDLEKNSYELIEKNDIKNGILRISISRGIGSLGYIPTYESESLIIIQTSAERKIITGSEKVLLGVSSVKKPPRNSLPIFCKTMQALPSVMTKIEAEQKKLFDLVMLSQKNFISETSSANIFWVKNGKIFTPAKSCDMLPGTIRKKLLKISPIKISEVEGKLSDLKKADEIFLTNSSFLVLPVDEFVFFEKGKRRAVKMQKTVGLKILSLIKKDLELYSKNKSISLLKNSK